MHIYSKKKKNRGEGRRRGVFNYYYYLLQNNTQSLKYNMWQNGRQGTFGQILMQLRSVIEFANIRYIIITYYNHLLTC